MNWKLMIGLVLLAGGAIVIGTATEMIDLEPETEAVDENNADVQTPQVVVNSPHNVCPTPEPWRNHW